MKRITLFIAAAALLAACQQAPKQYFEASPEIDMAKKATAAYVAADWETMRSLFADTAKIADNVWNPADFVTVDQWIERFKTDRANNFPEVSIGDDAVYNMVVTDKGEKYVLCWLNWSGKTKDGKAATAPVHLFFQVAGGKFAWHGAIFNALPGYLAMQPAPAAAPAQP
jgi:hypothetical protein